ncbi:hypothetical protein DPMN_144201 [Dreissena polymorpha]|uniref:C-type lectin domain-containing protein n=2 Tax=Dreissena polymorpha TaxID=45954 RepID=A0A9D4GIG7_DREPO|nr:hypothetical protein DPMN_144201 [Dreissena polymorpha]
MDPQPTALEQMCVGEKLIKKFPHGLITSHDYTVIKGIKEHQQDTTIKMSGLQLLFIGVAYLCSFTFGIKCPHGFEEYNHACYTVVKDAVAFVDAYRRCEAMNSYLLNVDSTPELNFLRKLVGRAGGWVQGFWTGGFYDTIRRTQGPQGRQGTWFWRKTDLNGRETVTQVTPDNTDVNWWGIDPFNNWYPAEHWLMLNTEKHWLMLNTDDFKLYGETYFVKLGYICETVAK